MRYKPSLLPFKMYYTDALIETRIIRTIGTMKETEKIAKKLLDEPERYKGVLYSTCVNGKFLDPTPKTNAINVAKFNILYPKIKKDEDYHSEIWELMSTCGFMDTSIDDMLELGVNPDFLDVPDYPPADHVYDI